MVMLLERRLIQFFVYKKLDPSSYVSPLYKEGETYRFTSYRSFLCHISFVSVRSVLSVYLAGGQTRDIVPKSGYFWPTVYDAEPTLARHWVTVSCLTPRCMWANISPAFVQSIVQVLHPA